LRAQGKEVPEKVSAKARKKFQEKEELEAKRHQEELEESTKQMMEDFAAYANEQPKIDGHWAHDCTGKKLQIHVPTINADQMIGIMGKLYLQLRQVQILSLGNFPDGIDPDKYGFRGVELVNPQNDAHILVLFERLFLDGGEGAGVGLHIDGVFVVDKVVDGRARWKLIPEPYALYASDDNRYYRLIKYLELAKEKAKPVPPRADLGINNPGDPDMSMIPTQFGTYLKMT